MTMPGALKRWRSTSESDMNDLEAAVRYACRRMGVELIRSGDWRPDDDGRVWNFGPATASLSMDGTPAIYSQSDWSTNEEWIHVLHELEHFVFFHPDKGFDIGESLMMPWSVGVLRASGIPGHLYMQSTYTQDTGIEFKKPSKSTVGVPAAVWHWRRPERSWWYKSAVRAQLAAGTLGADLLPTWRRPDWSKINIEEHP